MPEVFISYAHADDHVMVDGAKGWVTTFADRLHKAVNTKPGGSGTSVWMDHRLEPQRAVDSALAERVGRADCFVALMSPRYLESSWCRDEMDGFIQRRGGAAANRVFVIETLPTDRSRWHPAARSLVGVPFWAQDFDEAAPMPLGWPVPQAEDRPYWKKLNELAHTLASQLAAAPAAVATSTATPAAPRRVWIADPTDHVIEHWEALSAALRQAGAEVLPAAVGLYPLAVEAQFQAALSADLGRADLLVQLFGPHPGKKPPWSASPLSRLQSERAQAFAARRGLSYLPWRPPDVVLEAIANDDHRRLLTGSSACSFADLQARVIALLSAPPPGLTPPASAAPEADAPLTICVNADTPDRDLGERVRDLLFDEFEVDVNLAAPPQPDQLPAQWRLNYEQQLQQSHGLVIVYGLAPASWVQAEVQAAKKTLAQARRGVWGAVLDGAPPTRPDHGVRSRSLMAIDCRAGLAREPLARFVDALRGGVPAHG